MKKNSANGILLIDKPEGLTSHDVVGKLRRALQIKQIGHAGTLDPMATGLLVLLIGEATKLSDYLLNRDKSYQLGVKFGTVTDSWDMDGNILKETKVQLQKEEILKATDQLQGDLELKVPQFSAIKINGEKLYKSAHKGEVVETPTREMSFYNLEVIEAGGDQLKANISCQKGGYIRSWANELGLLLKVGACLSSLRRLESSPYKIEDSLTLSEVIERVEAGESVNDLSNFKSINDCLPDWKTVTVSGRDETLMSNGQIPKDLSRRLIFEQKQASALQRVIGVKVMRGSTGRLLSLIEAQPNKGLKLKRSFNV